MCRFVYYQGPPIALDCLLTGPAHSIAMQSHHSREHHVPVHADGCGVAWYVPELSPEPGVFHSLRPAWNNPNLFSLARVTVSPCVLAHVRAASPGLAVDELNCHPFTHGRLAFMHNGLIGGFATMRRLLRDGLSDRAEAAIAGTTDSEHAFALLLDTYAEARASDPAERLAEAVERMVARLLALRERLRLTADTILNLVVSDGEVGVALRFTTAAPEKAYTLYLHTGSQYVCDNGSFRMLDAGLQKGAVLLCSEPLSLDPGWRPVPPNHLVVVRRDRTVAIRPCAAQVELPEPCLEAALA